jgi:hypothetical protein
MADKVQICNKTVQNDKQNPILHTINDAQLMTRIVDQGLIERIDRNLPTALLLILSGLEATNATRSYDLIWVAKILTDLAQQGSGTFKIILAHDINGRKCELLSDQFLDVTRHWRAETVRQASAFIDLTKGSQIDICDPNQRPRGSRPRDCSPRT